MGSDLEKWQVAAAMTVGSLLILWLFFFVWNRVADRRRSQYLIAAARVRSGYVPGGLPTVRGGATGSTGMGELGPASAPQPLAANEGEFVFEKMVDEQPLIRLRYIDALSRKVDEELQVEHLDLRKRLVVGFSDHPGDTRRIPLRNIVGARIAETGQRFDIDTWVDAVRVARRRRGQKA